MLPVAYHVDLTNFNWTPLVLAFCLAAVLFAWFAPGCGARHWYHGKAHTLESTSVPPVVRGVPSMLLHACMHQGPRGCIEWAVQRSTVQGCLGLVGLRRRACKEWGDCCLPERYVTTTTMHLSRLLCLFLLMSFRWFSSGTYTSC